MLEQETTIKPELSQRLEKVVFSIFNKLDKILVRMAYFQLIKKLGQLRFLGGVTPVLITNIEMKTFEGKPPVETLNIDSTGQALFFERLYDNTYAFNHYILVTYLIDEKLRTFSCIESKTFEKIFLRTYMDELNENTEKSRRTKTKH